MVYRGWVVAANQQLRFCEANLVGLDEGRLVIKHLAFCSRSENSLCTAYCQAKRERMGGDSDNPAYMQGLAAEPVMPWRNFQLALNLYERREV